MPSPLRTELSNVGIARQNEMAVSARPTLLHLERIRLFSPSARDLLAYILQERKRVSKIHQATLGSC